MRIRSEFLDELVTSLLKYTIIIVALTCLLAQDTMYAHFAMPNW